ncbi:segmentation polarity homeobox protein engrailed [Neodiprion fabricii]|uniref:segmentation polarity homeobox protein engrailed n=1 Tax=Neodiprion fabricii TaxID=2872261 RepID=UPI001ED977C6|nr:segmentation polarity homeobox protein engrailed [Neodiprion fabricii]
MSEARRSQRLSTDFSIARILAADEPCSTSSTSSSSGGSRVPQLPSSCPCCPTPLSAPFVVAVPEQRETGAECPSPPQPSDSGTNAGAVAQDNSERNDLPWLHCTRYRPPRLPKRSTAGKTSKRRPGKHPRIPFTAFQLQILEDKYSKGAYLARRDVLQLSTVLRLPQSRVKIWFQNRRARERRESLQSRNDVPKSAKSPSNVQI